MTGIRKPSLSSQDYQNIDALLGHVLEDFRAGSITKEEAISGLAHVIAAIDKGNYAEVTSWLKEGRKLIRSHR